MDLRKKTILSLYQEYKKTETHFHQLNYLFWECTLRCNFNCVHCGSDCTQQSWVPDMPKEDFLRVLSDIRPHVDPHKTMIVITGGEPLVRKDLEACGRAIYDLEYPWGFVTNGYGLSQKRLDSLLSAGLRSVTVSLDGYNEESHEWFRVKQGSWLRAVNAIYRVASTPDLTYDVVTCVHKKNIDELPQLKNLLLSLGVKHWRLFTVFSKGRAKDNPLLKLSPEEFVRMLDFIRETRREGEINASYGCEGYLGEYEMEVRDQPFFCQAGIHIGSVLANGDISACPSLRSDYIQGNIYQDDFWTVWNTRFQIMRDRSWTKTGRCASCKAYKQCQGNGLHLRDEKTGALLQCHLEMMGK
ncbi:MAG TPA: radical SAM/SPASM domain-containing protein [Porphyromonadaceae bacterium]|jgi:radical SAM enzyme (rSAM/lipoprotein system)|nr:radical SAM/SPASM domain-containing protein [Porphyromonadaceae bacterium]HBL33525.1 radical SAM/SPASM domain-containing protein [Porphyromonadaceae bacterium]